MLDRNWRCADGEIDIVAAERRVLVVCEVKTRSGTRYGTPLEAISRKKRGRLRRLAVRWVVAHGVLFDEIRIDVIGVLRGPSGEFTVSTSGGWARCRWPATHSIALVGVQGHPVEIEADIENGLVGLLLVGLPDTALREARDRIGRRSSTARRSGRSAGSR